MHQFQTMVFAQKNSRTERRNQYHIFILKRQGIFVRLGEYKHLTTVKKYSSIPYNLAQ